MKIVINKCYGGFGLSDKAVEMIMNRKGLNCFRYVQTKYKYSDRVNEFTRCDETEANNHLCVYYVTKDLGEKTNNLPIEFYWSVYSIDRNDADLIAVVEKLGEEANGKFSKIKIVEIPDDVNWYIDEYDGIEVIYDENRCWR